MRFFLPCFLIAALLPLQADEGMWLFNNPPVKQLKEKYGFEPSPQWLQHVQRSSVRFNNGGSGSFVSPEGLVMTNHHVASDCIAKLSTKDKDLIKAGFLAKTSKDELRCVDLELNQLLEIEDVTARVNGAITAGMDTAAAQKARLAITNAIEKESLDKTGLRSDVVTLYNGGLYHLYRYKRYTDVRLAFAPESGIAFFGGDPDNFEFPRYDLDVSFLRVYEKDAPVKTPDYFKWSSAGPKDGELIFVSGHPGKTDRLDTMRHLEELRDRINPTRLNVLRRREVLLKSWAERSAENARRAQDDLFAIQNSRKALNGMLAGLQDPSILAKKQAEQEKLRATVAASAKLQAEYGGAWDEVSKAIATLGTIYAEHYLLEAGQAFSSELFHIARDLVRHADESRKPNAQRFARYNESGLESLKLATFSDAPVYKDLETEKLADSLAMAAEWMGTGHPQVKQILAGKSPRERAAELVNGARIADVAERRKLFDASPAEIRASGDPMIQLALLVDPPARKVRAIQESQVDEPLRQAYAKIAQARFAAYGPSVYPDATFTLRLAFGAVRGYDDAGRKIPPMTSIGGAYAHAADHGYKDPFDLPQIWKDKKNSLDLSTPFNFVNTADIIGGNSGSPTLNQKGEIVGIIFDGNIQSLVSDYIYDEEQSRAISVHSAAILQALTNVYDASNIAQELTR